MPRDERDDRDDDDYDVPPGRRRRRRDDDDEQDEVERRGRHLDGDEDDDDRPMRRRRRYDDDDRRGPDFPVSLKVAGWLWIGFGALGVIGTLIAAVAGQNRQPNQMVGNQAAGFQTGLVCGYVFAGLVSAAFIFVGFQSVNGTARDTMGNAIGSICFGLFYVGLVIICLAVGARLEATVVVLLLVGIALLTAGGLAIAAREDYLDWKKFSKRRARTSKRYFRKRHEDDDD